MERLHDFVKVVSTLSEEEFVEQFPHPILFYSKIPGRIEQFVHTRMVDREESESSLHRFSEQLRDFVPLLPRGKSSREFPLKAFVGRDERRDYVIPHSTVSNRHASFLYRPKEDTYWLVDAGSTNGTFLRGKTLVAGEPARLRDGDVIAFGRMEFLFFTPSGAYRYLRQYRMFQNAMKGSHRSKP